MIRAGWERSRRSTSERMVAFPGTDTEKQRLEGVVETIRVRLSTAAGEGNPQSRHPGREPGRSLQNGYPIMAWNCRRGKSARRFAGTGGNARRTKAKLRGSRNAEWPPESFRSVPMNVITIAREY